MKKNKNKKINKVKTDPLYEKVSAILADLKGKSTATQAEVTRLLETYNEVFQARENCRTCSSQLSRIHTKLKKWAAVKKEEMENANGLPE